MSKSFKRQFSLWALGLAHERPTDFSLSSWQKSERPTPLLIFRLILASISVAILAWSLASALNGYWLIYLTNWGLLLVTATTLSGLIVSCAAQCGAVKEYGRTPWYASFYWLVYNVTVPIAFTITILYWVLLYEQSDEQTPASLWLDIATHGFNSVIVLAEVAASRTPTRILHFYQPLGLGLWYAAFSAIYYAAGGTDENDNPYVYAVLDWSDPGSAGALVGVSAAGLFALHVLVWALANARGWLAERMRTHSHDLPSAPPLHNDPPEARIV